VPNKYLSYDAERAPKVRQMFSRLAKRYDLVNDIMSFGLHRRWKRETVRIALGGLPPGARVLDLCCGTGDMVFSAEERRPDVKVFGADFTLPMLSVGRARAHEARLPVRWTAADALRLPFPDATFGAITVGYGLRNLADFEGGLAEMRRVLAPGGRVVILDFGKPAHPLAGALYQGFLNTMMPFVGWLFHRDPQTYLYIPESLKRYPAQRGVEQLMRRLGYANVRFEERLLGTMGINVGERSRESGIGNR
jgi:demethylmenaquinone methyltransferase/2-methoxy-6-polyprenyl-1,4-benzoquinol methylase